MDEFSLIRRWFAELTPPGEGIALGIGDDCALLVPPPGAQLAISTDTLIAGRHFPQETTAADIGWKSLAVSLSDLAAMGAQPFAFTLALSLPAVDEPWLAGFADGLRECARTAGIALVGGDTTRGPLSITITVLGHLPPETALRRDAARSGDLICVSGTLGDAALALRFWQDGRAPASAHERMLRARLDRPTPRNAAGVASRGLAHAAIDLSDGLLGDLGHICQASGVGAELAIGELPASPAFAALAPTDARLGLQIAGGDDYELCLCVPPAQLEAVRKAYGALPLTVIGRIVEVPGIRLRDAAGAIVTSPAQAYRHFS
ncbi:thiamine-phosphate kinase [Solimonas terrae]|uniref:Thiamine-monophosphate kinase n=1 Tax=Solimonas terrae TaxID=1396819 RepID=A0A6M2BML3_9GAMM|nr:thiamine-phosphate kinase [Solimonas terrae]NGY03481.1 thiamine-phosphate kinase [Solimonas terrae]